MATINIDLTNPLNAIRAMVGDINICDPIMSDMMYQQLYDLNDVNGRSECIILWFAAIQAAEILLAHYAPDAMRQRERVNAVEVEFYGAERYTRYKDLVKWLRNNPPQGCSGSLDLFYFGGTYTQCDNIYTLKWMKNCLCACWPRTWVDGYTLGYSDDGEILI